MTAVVPAADSDALGVEEDDQGVEGGQAGGVGQGGALEEGGEDGFEAGGVGAGVAAVDVGVEGSVRVCVVPRGEEGRVPVVAEGGGCV